MGSRWCAVFDALCGGTKNTLWLLSSRNTGLYTVAHPMLHKGAFQTNPSFKVFILITSTCWTKHVLRRLSSFKMFRLTGKFYKITLDTWLLYLRSWKGVEGIYWNHLDHLCDRFMHVMAYSELLLPPSIIYVTEVYACNGWHIWNYCCHHQSINQSINVLLYVCSHQGDIRL